MSLFTSLRARKSKSTWKTYTTLLQHCATHSKSYCAMHLSYCVFIGMFKPLEFSFLLFLKAGAPIKACMNRQQCGRTQRQLAESRLAAVSWCCVLCTLFAGLSPNRGQEIGQDSQKIYTKMSTHSHIETQGMSVIQNQCNFVKENKGKKCLLAIA